MARNPRRQTFGDLVKEPTWSDTNPSRTGRNAPRLGAFNAAGEFFDLTGLVLDLVHEEVSPADAQRLVNGGASVVAEGCGCGGTYGGCSPEWVTDAEQLKQLRRGPAPLFTGHHGTLAWIDVWANAAGEVVFVHGDVSWGEALG